MAGKVTAIAVRVVGRHRLGSVISLVPDDSGRATNNTKEQKLENIYVFTILVNQH